MKRSAPHRIKARKSQAKASRMPLARELSRLSLAWLKHGLFGLPTALGQALVRDPAPEGAISEDRFLDLVGEVVLRFFDDLGPIYGKAGQMALSRLSPPLSRVAERLRLTRLYKDWPPLPFAEVESLLDAAVPHWRLGLTVEPHPLGVASLAQVHAARSADGREWVIKVIKPHARVRLTETIEALEQVLKALRPLAVTEVSRRSLRELDDLCAGFRRELSLGLERETIERVREKLRARRQKVLVIPEVNADYCTDDVLVVERFRGTALGDVVAGQVELAPAARRKLARAMLAELLVQVFELGLFHADPHAGNLILLEDGSVGLFDWGLAGELRDSDRRHIAAILKAVLTLDVERLIDALIAMGAESGREIPREEVRRELKAVITMVKKGREDPAERPSMQALFEQCLNGAARLGIEVPDGLLMMAKALLTIEGLARGIDPEVSLPRIAAPVLFRAAKPGLKDLMAMTKRFPQFARQLFGSGT